MEPHDTVSLNAPSHIEACLYSELRLRGLGARHRWDSIPCRFSQSPVHCSTDELPCYSHKDDVNDSLRTHVDVITVCG